jgi:hypothetical protein
MNNPSSLSKAPDGASGGQISPEVFQFKQPDKFPTRDR